MQQAGRTYKRYQKLLDDKVLKPIKNIVIADAVARGMISGSGKTTTKGFFNFGANVSIDLGRESASAIAEFKAGLRTASDIYSERGMDVEAALRARAIETKMIQDLAKEYGVPPQAVSEILLPTGQPQGQAQQQTQDGQPVEGQQDLIGQSLNGAQVASLINVINAVAAGALSRDGAISVIVAAFPTISREQAQGIVAGVQQGKMIPTTEKEKQATQDQGNTEEGQGGSAIPVEPKTPQTPTGLAQKKSSLEILQNFSQHDLKMLIAGMMGGIELGKYDGIDFTPPEGAREAAKRALDVREKKPASQRGMTPVGIARARDLMNGVKLSPDTVRRMKAFFDRHEVDKKGATWDEQGKGWQAWNGWGGDAGYAWARKVVGQMESRDNGKTLEEPATCPIATQDIKVNLKNRQTAVDDANYGPANPNEPNENYWKAKANEFQGDIATAKKMLCGNCAAFNQTSKILNCIKRGIGEDANEVAIAGDLGYCEIFDFKCAAKRTCDAWIVGGPMTDEKANELARPGPKSAAQTPAPPKERIKGSKENPKGTASTRSKAGDIEISAQNEEALKNKIAEFKDKHPLRKAPTLGALKKVFRRGAGAFSTSFRPTISGGKPNSRNAWAMARVNKFLKMAGGGEVKESYRKADGDLLEERFEDCGTGAGGFKPGNTCAGGGGEDSEIKTSKLIEKNTLKEDFQVTRIGEIDKNGAYVGIKGQTSYEGGKEYILPMGSKIADLRDVETSDLLIKETLKDKRLNDSDKDRLKEAIGQGDLDYQIFDETPMSESAKRLGFDGVRVVENDDLPGQASSIFVININKLKEK
jgi:hypothetical protein